jgi:hypothetical protein
MPEHHPRLSILGTVIIAMASFLLAPFTPLTLRIKVLGVSRLFGSFGNLHGEDTKVIPDTLFTEDLHYHGPSHQLFGASESEDKTRNTWFPPCVGYQSDHN